MKFFFADRLCFGNVGRAPRGARGLKCRKGDRKAAALRRAPRGARGLKFVDHRGAPPLALVAPLAGRVD